MWFKKKKVKDFVPPLQEQKEVLGDSMKELLDGRLLADTVLRKNIGFILFLTFLGIVYIANGYATEKLYMKKVNMEKEGDGKMLKNKFGVKVYPTYLLINPDGTLYNKFVGGAYVTAFADKLKNALLGEEDEYTKKERMQKGN